MVRKYCAGSGVSLFSLFVFPAGFPKRHIHSISQLALLLQYAVAQWRLGYFVRFCTLFLCTVWVLVSVACVFVHDRGNIGISWEIGELGFFRFGRGYKSLGCRT